MKIKRPPILPRESWIRTESQLPENDQTVWIEFILDGRYYVVDCAFYSNSEKDFYICDYDTVHPQNTWSKNVPNITILSWQPMR